MKKGFTLIEILITMVVLGILISLSASYFSSSVSLANLDSSARIMKTELLQAQQLATVEQIKYFVQFKENSYIIYKENGETIKEVKLLGKTKIIKTTFNNKYPGKDIMFFNTSGAPLPGGTVCLQATNGRCKCVVVSIGFGNRIRTGESKKDCEGCKDCENCSY